MFKRTTLCLLAAAMTLSMAAGLTSCKPNDTTGEGEGTYGRYDKEVHFTTVRQAVTDPKMPDGMTLADNPYVDFMKKELNVTYEVLWEDSMYNDRLLLDLTSGTLPDVFVVNDYRTYQLLYDSDLLADLTDVYDQHAWQEMKDIYNSYGDRMLSPVTEGGRLMALPSTSNGYQEALLWVRKDWLDALGLQEPKTIEEIASVARQFVAQDPGGNGKGNTVGIAYNREHSFTGYRQSYGLEPVANSMNAFPKQWMQNDAGEIYYGSIQPEFKQVLGLTRSWIESGVLDESFMEASWGTIYDSVISGRAGMWFYPWNWAYESQFIEKNPRAELSVYPAPLDANGKATYATGVPFESMLCVRKGYEHPEVIFKVIHLWHDMYNGVHQEGYDALEPTREMDTVWYYIAPMGTYDYRYDNTIQRDTEKLKDYVDNGVEPEPFSPSLRTRFDRVKSWIENQDTSANWSEYMTRYVASEQEYAPECNPVHPVFFFQTDTMIDQWDNLLSMERDMIRTILNGEEALDSFDQFVEDWRTAGGDQITKEVAEFVSEH